MRNSVSKQTVSAKLLQQHIVDIRQAWSDIASRPITSLGTLLAIASTLLTPLVLLVVSSGLASTLEQYSSMPRVTAYLIDSAENSLLTDVSERLLQRNDISLVELVPKSSAFAQLTANTGLANLLTQLEDNPLPDALIITPLDSDIAKLESLARELELLPEVELVQLDSQWIRRLQKFTELVANLGFLLSTTALVGFFLVIGNSVKVSIQRAQEEIRVLKLIGATDFFILRPLLYSGLFYGLAAAIIALALQAAVLASFASLVNGFLIEYDTMLPDSGVFSLGVNNAVLVLVASSLAGLLAAFSSAYREIRYLGP